MSTLILEVLLENVNDKALSIETKLDGLTAHTSKSNKMEMVEAQAFHSTLPAQCALRTQLEKELVANLNCKQIKAE